MYYRVKKEFRLPGETQKWIRTSYRKFAALFPIPEDRDMYEIKDQTSQSPAQLEALALGRALRHANAAVAQSQLALQYLSALPPHLKSEMETMIVQEEGKHYPIAYKDFGSTRASLSLANQFAQEALTSIKQLTKKGAALKPNQL